MTEQSYLPPELGQPSRSEIMPCEPNAAQIPDRKPVLVISGALVFVGGFALFGWQVSGPANRALIIVAIALMLAGMAMAVAEFVLNTRLTARRLEATEALYPACSMQDYALIVMYRPQIGCDGRKHGRDIGFLTIEDDCLRWRGVWFQFQVRREDIKSIEGANSSHDHMILMHKDAFADIRRLMTHEMPNGKGSFTLKTNRRLRDWHKGKTRDE